MPALPAPTPLQDLPSATALTRIARFPNLRALAWSGDQLYASRGYQLLRARVQSPSDAMHWEPAGIFRPSFRRRISVLNSLSARLFRDGFHALAAIPSGDLVAAVPGAIVALRANETEFRVTHTITRGTRPLHVTAVPGGAVYWGEYFDNRSRDPVHIYASSDAGATWSIAYTFPKGAIRHVHNIVHDPWENCFWVLTGDYGDECRILRAALDFSRVESVLQGNQQARAVALVPTADALYFSSDTPLEANYTYRLDRPGKDRAGEDRVGEDRAGKLTRLAPITSSSIYGCRVADHVFFSTMVEPSQINRDRNVRIYGASPGEDWRPLLAWRKDRWPMALFQYGNAFLPDGDNTTPFLAVTTIAIESDDMATSLYAPGPR